MAGLDYVSCNLCGKRLFYDGEGTARNYMNEVTKTSSVSCDHCVKKLLKKIEKLKKFDKRRH